MKKLDKTKKPEELMERCIAILKELPDIVYQINPDGYFNFINNSVKVLGYEPKELIGKHFSQIIHPDDVKSFSRPFVLPKYNGKVTGNTEAPKLIDERRTGDRKTKEMEIRLIPKSWEKRRKDSKEIIGSIITLGDVSSTGHYDTTVTEKNKKFLGTLGIIRDITKRKQMEDALRKSEKHYKNLVEEANVAISIDNIDGEIVYYNEKFAELFGYSYKEIKNKSIESLIHSDDIERVMGFHKERIQGKEVPNIYEFKGIKKDGLTIYLEIDVVELKDKKRVIGTRSYFWDVTARKCVENALRMQLLDDELTGLHNRRGFSILAHQQLKLADRKKNGFWILFADLDKLKWINDNFGHKQGDLALKETADILRKSFRKSDIIARIGGDEFAVLAVETAADSVEILVKRIQKTLKSFNARRGRQYELSLSIGSVYYEPQKPIAIDELLARADTKMYKQKRKKQ